jgi:hypothetical protein
MGGGETGLILISQRGGEPKLVPSAVLHNGRGAAFTFNRRSSTRFSLESLAVRDSSVLTAIP